MDKKTTYANEKVSTFDSMLQSMGIISIVSKASAGNRFYEELSSQLVDILFEPLKVRIFN